MSDNLPDSSNVTANILAGGRATRMQGQDKGLVLLGNRPMIAHVIERLTPQLNHIYITANRNLEAYRQFSLPLISDSIADFPGPLAGFLAALINIRNEWLLNVPCDAPFLPGDILARLSNKISNSTEKKIAVARTTDGLQPTFCLIHHSLQQDLQSYLEQGGRKTGQWILDHNPAIVDYADEAIGFANINTPDELKNAQHHFNG